MIFDCSKSFNSAHSSLRWNSGDKWHSQNSPVAPIFTVSVGWRCSVGLTYLLPNSAIITVVNTGRVLRAIGRFAFMLYQTSLSVPLSDGCIKYLCASDYLMTLILKQAPF